MLNTDVALNKVSNNSFCLTNFPNDISPTVCQFPDISRFFRKVVILSDNDADLRVRLQSVIAVVRCRFHGNL